MTEQEKKKLMSSEFGSRLARCIRTFDEAMQKQSRYPCGADEYENARRIACQAFAQWEIFQIAIKHFCAVKYAITRTDDYFGLVTEDEADWLMKEYR